VAAVEPGLALSFDQQCALVAVETTTGSRVAEEIASGVGVWADQDQVDSGVEGGPAPLGLVLKIEEAQSELEVKPQVPRVAQRHEITGPLSFPCGLATRETLLE